MPPAVRAAYLANDAGALVACVRRGDREPSVEEALPGVSMPVLLFVGQGDRERCADPHLAAGQLPDVTFAVITGEDHASTLLRRDKVLPHVAAFLERVAPRRATP